MRVVSGFQGGGPEIDPSTKSHPAPTDHLGEPAARLGCDRVQIDHERLHRAAEARAARSSATGSAASGGTIERTTSAARDDGVEVGEQLDRTLARRAEWSARSVPRRSQRPARRRARARPRPRSPSHPG